MLGGSFGREGAMGRFSAPQFGEDDGGGAAPMDWDAISDDDDDGNGEVTGNGAPSHPTGYGSCASSTSCTDVAHRAGDYEDTVAERNEMLLRAAEQYLEHSVQRLEREQLQERKRTRVRWVAVVAVAIVAIVLKRHAPPPPPLSTLSMGSRSTSFWGGVGVASDSESFSSGSSADGNGPGMSGVVHHETWAGYSRQLGMMFHHSLAYGMSVAWYAVSNAFCYTWEEARDGIHAVVQGARHIWADARRKIDVLSPWVYLKRKMDFVGNWFQLQMNGKRQHSQDVDDVQESGGPAHNKIKACPIRIPAVSKRHAQLSENAERWSTEDFLRQTIGTSLSPQNLAIKVIAEGLDAWGESLAEAAPEALVNNMAAVTAAAGPEGGLLDKETLSERLLPPATGFLLIGSEGVGKRHTARRLARVLLGHCRSTDELPKVPGVLEVNAEDYGSNNKHQLYRATTLIVDHIRSRKGMGSVVIINHIESLPTDLLSDISKVLSGESESLSYGAGDNLVEASCNGTIFVLTSTRWGTSHILEHIQRNGGQMSRLHRGMESDALISAIRSELEFDFHLDYGAKLARHATIAPFFPFQQEDLASILQGRIHALNLEHEGVHWKRLEVSLAAVKHSVGMDRVDYDELYSEEDIDAALLAFATGGAHSLESNPLWETLKTRYATDAQKRPEQTLKVRLDDGTKETVFSWCGMDDEGIERCDVELRSALE